MELVILSLDPGSSKIGWALTTSSGETSDYGFLSPLEEVPKTIPFNHRMNLLVRRLILPFKEKVNKADYVAWEIVPSFGQMSQRELVQATAITLKVITFQKKLPYQQFSPQGWHKEFLDKGKCTKKEVKDRVLFFDKEIEDDLPFDVYDAIAIGKVAAKKNEWITNEL